MIGRREEHRPGLLCQRWDGGDNEAALVGDDNDTLRFTGTPMRQTTDLPPFPDTPGWMEFSFGSALTERLSRGPLRRRSAADQLLD